MHKRILFLLLALLCSWGIVRGQNAENDSLKIYLDKGTELVNKGEWVPAADMYYAASRLAQQKGDVKALCSIQSGLAKIAASTENNEGLKQVVLLAERYCTTCKDTSNLARVFMYKAILTYKTNQLDSAVLFFQKASDLYMQIKDTLRSINALAKVGNVLEEQGRYQEANNYYQLLYKEAMRRPDEFYQMTANIYLAGNYLYLEKPQDVLRYAQEVQRLAQKNDSKYEYSVALEYEAGAYNLMGQFEKAYLTQRRYSSYYKDTLVNAERTEQIETLKTKYETTQKENQIVIQAQELKQQRTTLWAVATGLFLVLVGGALLYRLTLQLRKRNAEKEFLIKEIHHRVKNNLQIISSLLSLQSKQIKDEIALDAVREGKSRVEAMGLIHQKLYMGDNLAVVNMKEYVHELADTLLDAFGLDNEERVRVVHKVEDFTLDVDHAIPLGLIINELVTNSLKYAFPDGRSGEVDISLWKDEKGGLNLQVSDNGVGLNGQSAPAKGTGFGTNLVHMLSKKLKGNLQVQTPGKGYATLIHFDF
jgi:two-component system, sensor histidine kinase PdtaS